MARFDANMTFTTMSKIIFLMYYDDETFNTFNSGAGKMRMPYFI